MLLRARVRARVRCYDCLGSGGRCCRVLSLGSGSCAWGEGWLCAKVVESALMWAERVGRARERVEWAWRGGHGGCVGLRARVRCLGSGGRCCRVLSLGNGSCAWGDGWPGAKVVDRQRAAVP